MDVELIKGFKSLSKATYKQDVLYFPGFVVQIYMFIDVNKSYVEQTGHRDLQEGLTHHIHTQLLTCTQVHLCCFASGCTSWRGSCRKQKHGFKREGWCNRSEVGGWGGVQRGPQEKPQQYRVYFRFARSDGENTGSVGA